MPTRAPYPAGRTNAEKEHRRAAHLGSHKWRSFGPTCLLAKSVITFAVMLLRIICRVATRERGRCAVCRERDCMRARGGRSSALRPSASAPRRREAIGRGRVQGTQRLRTRSSRAPGQWASAKKRGEEKLGKRGDAPLRAEFAAGSRIGLGLGGAGERWPVSRNVFGARSQVSQPLARSAPDGLSDKISRSHVLLDVVVSATYRDRHGLFTFMPSQRHKKRRSA
jgi:hypothetical protein